MKKYILGLGFLFLGITVFAQEGTYNPLNSSMQILEKEDAILKEVKGSPYFEDNYTPGIIMDNEGRNVNAFLRYNVLNDQMEIKVDQNGAEVYTLPKTPRYTYKLKNYTYVVDQFRTENGEALSGYIISYHLGDNLFFISKPVADVTPGQKATSGYGGAKPASLKIDQKFYLGTNKNSLKEIKMKEKDFKDVLGSNPAVNQYLKNNKIKDTNDAIKMLAYLENKE